MREIKFRALCRGVWIEWTLFEEPTKAIDIETIGQFTGLKDKDGKEIYEGDILLRHDGAKAKVEDIRDIYFMDTKGNEAEVIGNIYENPELLK